MAHYEICYYRHKTPVMESGISVIEKINYKFIYLQDIQKVFYLNLDQKDEA